MYWGVSIQVHELCFGMIAFCKNPISLWLPGDQQQDSVWLTSHLVTFSLEVRWPCTQLLELAFATAVATSRNRHKSTVWGSTATSAALPRALNSHPRYKKKKNRHPSHRCQVTHKKEVNHWLFLAFTVWLWFPSFPQPILMPSGLQLAHFISTTAAKKSAALPCDNKQSVLILVPQCALEESQMSPNYMPSPEGLCLGPPWPERWWACHKSLAVKAQGTEKHRPPGSDRNGPECLFCRDGTQALPLNTGVELEIWTRILFTACQTAAVSTNWIT